jgi:single-stranded-DNA-specific exonuclease
VFPDCKILFAKRVGANHLKISFGDGLGARIDAISFGAMDGPLGPMLTDHAGAMFHLAGRLEVNTWQGRKNPQLRLGDAVRAS